MDKIELEIAKCKITPLFKLGQGSFGTTFKYTNPKTNNSFVIKYVGVDSTIDAYLNSEWQCTNNVYKALYKKLPFHVINPITTWCCKKSEIDSSILPFLFNPRFPSLNYDLYKVMVFDKLGDFTLKHFIKQSHISKKVRYEIILQLLVFFIYLKMCTNVVHNDLHSDNIVLRKNTNNCLLTFISPTHVYTMIPEYVAYPIDFGCCRYSGLEDTDFNRLWTKIIYTIIDNKATYFNKQTENFYTSSGKDEIRCNIILKNKKLGKCKESKKFFEKECQEGIFTDYITVTKRDNAKICKIM
jgi:serine/threonine protein kinase